jgi:hypothetical protein
MTTDNSQIVVGATERLISEVDKHTAIDAFLDQTRHVCEHGGTLTDLGWLILEERLQKKCLQRRLKVKPFPT